MSTDRYREEGSWLEYLDRMTRPDGPLSTKHVSSVRDVWRLLRTEFPSLPTPQAGPTPHGGLTLIWDRHEHHVDIDVLPDGQIEWFYSNRVTRFFEGGEATSPETIPGQLYYYLAKIVQACHS